MFLAVAVVVVLLCCGGIMDSLTEVDDLIDTDDKLEEITEDLTDDLLDNPKMQKIDSALQKLLKQLD
jgi:hypothetical protein